MPFKDSLQTRTVSGLDISRFLSRVYGWMTFGLLITAVTGYMISSNAELAHSLLRGPGLIVAIVLQFGLVIALSAGIKRMSVGTATACFLLYSFVTGVTFSTIFLVYKLDTIGQVFAITAGTFGTMAIYGFITKRDLSGMGSFMLMGLFGVIIASVVNIFMHSAGLDFAVSILCVAIFSGLTAWDVQKLKQIAASGDVDSDESHKMAIYGALSLYLDFINLFFALLRIFGGGRSRD